MALQVKRDGRVVVRCPLWVSDEEAERFAGEHREWIDRHLEEVLRTGKGIPPACQMDAGPEDLAVGPEDGCDLREDYHSSAGNQMGELQRQRQSEL